jgi:alpha-D-ribose 1-methylphosphonate 5-phosphate C-P lyase
MQTLFILLCKVFLNYNETILDNAVTSQARLLIFVMEIFIPTSCDFLRPVKTNVKYDAAFANYKTNTVKTYENIKHILGI